MQEENGVWIVSNGFLNNGLLNEKVKNVFLWLDNIAL